MIFGVLQGDPNTGDTVLIVYFWKLCRPGDLKIVLKNCILLHEKTRPRLIFIYGTKLVQITVLLSPVVSFKPKNGLLVQKIEVENRIHVSVNSKF
jgi:hypothetical protein